MKDKKSEQEITMDKNVSKSLFVLALRDLMRNDKTLSGIQKNDESLSMTRMILHIRNKYKLHITKKMFEEEISDANQLIDKVINENLEQ